MRRGMLAPLGWPIVMGGFWLGGELADWTAYIAPFGTAKDGPPEPFRRGQGSGSRFRANAHISKSRYGAPDFWLLPDVGRPRQTASAKCGGLSTTVEMTRFEFSRELIQEAFGYAFVGVDAAVA